MPRLRNVAAAARPPMPAPTMATDRGFVLGRGVIEALLPAPSAPRADVLTHAFAPQVSTQAWRSTSNFAEVWCKYPVASQPVDRADPRRATRATVPGSAQRTPCRADI